MGEGYMGSSELVCFWRSALAQHLGAAFPLSISSPLPAAGGTYGRLESHEDAGACRAPGCSQRLGMLRSAGSENMFP